MEFRLYYVEERITDGWYFTQSPQRVSKKIPAGAGNCCSSGESFPRRSCPRNSIRRTPGGARNRPKRPSEADLLQLRLTTALCSVPFSGFSIPPAWPSGRPISLPLKVTRFSDGSQRLGGDGADQPDHSRICGRTPRISHWAWGIQTKLQGSEDRFLWRSMFPDHSVYRERGRSIRETSRAIPMSHQLAVVFHRPASGPHP
jgi:hypothetical protein